MITLITSLTHAQATTRCRSVPQPAGCACYAAAGRPGNYPQSTPAWPSSASLESHCSARWGKAVDVLA
eukprot:6839242-Prymnesium_polylepis.1